MEVDSDSRQGLLATVSANLIAVKAKLTATSNLRIKRNAEQPEPTHCSENLIFRDSDPLEHETQGYKKGSSSHFEEEEREDG